MYKRPHCQLNMQQCFPNQSLDAINSTFNYIINNFLIRSVFHLHPPSCCYSSITLNSYTFNLPNGGIYVQAQYAGCPFPAFFGQRPQDAREARFQILGVTWVTVVQILSVLSPQMPSKRTARCILCYNHVVIKPTKNTF